MPDFSSAGEPAGRRSPAAVFAPRVQQVRALRVPPGVSGQWVEVRLQCFNPSGRGFRESRVGLCLLDDQVGFVEPPQMSVRDFQQALKRFHFERFTHPSPAVPPDACQVPRVRLEQIILGLEPYLDQRSEDVRTAPARRDTRQDRQEAQAALQREDRLGHQLVALGRYHRRKGDFLGGWLAGAYAGYGFTTGQPEGFHRDPNEDALGFDRAGGMEIYAVADAHHGAHSSELAICKLLNLFRLGFDDGLTAGDGDIRSFLSNAIARCHTVILRDLRADTSETSLVAAVRKQNLVYWASVGDALMVEVSRGRLRKINRDLGFGIPGKNLSIWLGNRRFRSHLIDSGCVDLRDGCFVLASDGIVKHRRASLGSFVSRVNDRTDLGVLAYRMAREYAVDGRDNTAFVILRRPQDASAG